MINKIRFIKNPLTIIAIFAGLAEIAGTTALALVDKELQNVFIWFVMGFPFLLVCLFFLTLNFNPTVLYAPADFDDESNFLRILASRKKFAEDVDLIDKQIEIAQTNIAERFKDEIKAIKDADQNKLVENLNQFMDSLREQLIDLQESADDVVNSASLQVSSNSGFQARILDLLSRSKHFMTVDQISSDLGMSKSATMRALSRLLQRKIIIRETHGEDETYSILF